MKLVVALNRKYPPPVLMNAVGHLMFGLPHGASARGADASLRRFQDAEGTLIACLTDMPLVVLVARNAEHLRQFHRAALEASLPVGTFLPAMLTGTPDEQYAELLSVRLAELDPIAVGAMGSHEELAPLTRRFSLLRESDLAASPPSPSPIKTPFVDFTDHDYRAEYDENHN